MSKVLHAAVVALALIVALTLDSCAGGRGFLIEKLPDASEGIAAFHELEGGHVTFVAKNGTTDRYVIFGDVLSVEPDGMLSREYLSFVRGNWKGTSAHGYLKNVLLKPGDSHVVRADLRKSYDNLDVSSSKPGPDTKPGWQRVSEYSTLDAAQRDFEKAATGKSLKHQRKVISPWIIRY